MSILWSDPNTGARVTGSEQWWEGLTPKGQGNFTNSIQNYMNSEVGRIGGPYQAFRSMMDPDGQGFDAEGLYFGYGPMEAKQTQPVTQTPAQPQAAIPEQLTWNNTSNPTQPFDSPFMSIYESIFNSGDVSPMWWNPWGGF